MLVVDNAEWFVDNCAWSKYWNSRQQELWTINNCKCNRDEEIKEKTVSAIQPYHSWEIQEIEQSCSYKCIGIPKDT